MKRTILPLALVLLVGGCAGQPAVDPPGTAGQAPATPTSASPSQVPTGQGKYSFQAPSGGTGTVELRGGPVPEIEELRTLAKGEAVGYVRVSVDNRAGTEAISIDGVSVFTSDGKELKYRNAAEYLEGLRQRLPGDSPADTTNKFANVSRTYSGDAGPQETKDFVMVGPEVPEQVTRVAVYPSGGANNVPASPAG